MKKEGPIDVKHYKELAIMGFVDIFLNIPKIIKYLRFCKKDIIDLSKNYTIDKTSNKIYKLLNPSFILLEFFINLL